MSAYFFTILSLTAVLFLGGCSSPNEVKGVCKSCKPYYVRGEWHYPQKHYDYDEIGLASWYGPGFHGKPKPHGEIYDQFEMTAAHKTLPIPTIALVTNLDTGQQAKVLIDDRGPFVYDGRIIDLSLAAAKKLGVYQKGTAHVRVTALADDSDRFSRHLAQYRKAKCPKGRRWVKIFQEDLAYNSDDLKSPHGESNFRSQVQPLTYRKADERSAPYLEPLALNKFEKPIVDKSHVPMTTKIKRRQPVEHDQLDQLIKKIPSKFKSKKTIVVRCAKSHKMNSGLVPLGNKKKKK